MPYFEETREIEGQIIFCEVYIVNSAFFKYQIKCSEYPLIMGYGIDLDSAWANFEEKIKAVKNARKEKPSHNGGILVKALDIINGEKQKEYGDPAVMFPKIAQMWSAYLGREISSEDVAMMMTLLKIARQSYEHKADNLIDAAGYIGLAADLVK